METPFIVTAESDEALSEQERREVAAVMADGSLIDGVQMKAPAVSGLEAAPISGSKEARHEHYRGIVEGITAQIVEETRGLIEEGGGKLRGSGLRLQTMRGGMRVTLLSASEEAISLHGWFQFGGQDDEEGECEFYEVSSVKGMIELLRELELSLAS